MPQDQSRDLTPVVPKKLRSSFIELLFCNLYAMAALCALALFSSSHDARPLILTAALAAMLGALLSCSLSTKIRLLIGNLLLGLSCAALVLIKILLKSSPDLLPADASLYALFACAAGGAFALVASLSAVLGLGPAKTAARRFNFALVTLPVGASLIFVLHGHLYYLLGGVAGGALFLFYSILRAPDCFATADEESASGLASLFLSPFFWVAILLVAFFVGLAPLANACFATTPWAALSLIPTFWLGMRFVASMAQGAISTQLFLVLLLATAGAFFAHENWAIYVYWALLGLWLPLLAQLALRGQNIGRASVRAHAPALLCVAALMGVWASYFFRF